MKPQIVKLMLSGKKGEGKFAMVDIQVYEFLTQNGRKWSLNSGNYGTSNSELMHRVVAIFYYGSEAVQGHIIDHIDGNRLNNTKENLRIVDSKANAKNRTTKTEDQPFEGVHLIPEEQIYCCRIKKFTVYKNTDPRICALCYDSVIFHVFGRGKRLNDNKSKDPLPISYWKLSEEIMAKLDKMKADHTDLRGVSKSGNAWKSKIVLNLGRFDTPEEAAKMYDLACLAFGKEETLNFAEGAYSAKDVSMFLQMFFGKLI